MNMYVCMCMEICPNKKLGFGFIQILGAVFCGTPKTVSKKFIFFLPPKLFLSRLNYFLDQLKLFFRLIKIINYFLGLIKGMNKIILHL